MLNKIYFVMSFFLILLIQGCSSKFNPAVKSVQFYEDAPYVVPDGAVFRNNTLKKVGIPDHFAVQKRCDVDDLIWFEKNTSQQISIFVSKINEYRNELLRINGSLNKELPYIDKKIGLITFRKLCLNFENNKPDFIQECRDIYLNIGSQREREIYYNLYSLQDKMENFVEQAFQNNLIGCTKRMGDREFQYYNQSYNGNTYNSTQQSINNLNNTLDKINSNNQQTNQLMQLNRMNSELQRINK